MSRRNRTAAARRRTATERQQRHATLTVLVNRMQRGVLLDAERDQLAGIITRELADTDALRGQVDDRRREHAAEYRRREAAEAAIVEAEAERDEYQQRYQHQMTAATEMIEQLGRTETELVAVRSTLDRIRQMADAWEQRLPDVIRTPAVVNALRNALDDDTRPVMFEVSARTAAKDAAAAVEARLAAEQRAELSDAVTAQWKRLLERRTATLRQRAEKAEAELAAARSHAAESEREIRRQRDHIRTVEQQLADVRKAYADRDAVATLRATRLDELEQHRQALADMLGCAPAASWPLLLAMVDSVIRGRATAETKAWDYAGTADRYEAAWRSARGRAIKHRDHAARRHTYAKQWEEQTARAVKQRDEVRALLRATEDQLAEARQRLAERPAVASQRCDVPHHIHIQTVPGPDCIRENPEEQPS